MQPQLSASPFVSAARVVAGELFPRGWGVVVAQAHGLQGTRRVKGCAQSGVAVAPRTNRFLVRRARVP